MCVAGIPNSNTTHAIDCILAAMEIRRIMETMRAVKQKQGFEYWELRLGIHTGPLVAGVIGENKFAYDVWGDTVNTAQRLQSAAINSQVVINEACYQKVKQSFNCKKIGAVSLKNKSAEMVLYEVLN